MFALIELIQETKVVPTMAGFTLMRAAVENSARGIYRLAAGTRAKRVLISLQTTYGNRLHAEPLAKSLGLQNPAGFKRMKLRLEQIRDKRKGIPRDASLESRTTITSILEVTDRQVPKTELTGIDVWRAGSGIAHGNRTVVFMLHERKVMSGVSPFRITASALVFAWMFQTCVKYLEHLLQMLADTGNTIERLKNHQ